MPSLPLRLARSLPHVILASAALFVGFTVVQPDGLPRLRALRHELAQVRGENAELSRSVERLRIEVKALREDPAAIEQIAREKLGLVRKNELVFQLRR